MFLHALDIKRKWDRGIRIVQELQRPSHEEQRQGECNAFFTHHRLDDIRPLYQEGRAKPSTLYDLETRRLQKRPIGLHGVPIADMPPHRFIRTNSALISGMLRV